MIETLLFDFMHRSGQEGKFKQLRQIYDLIWSIRFATVQKFCCENLRRA